MPAAPIPAAGEVGGLARRGGIALVGAGRVALEGGSDFPVGVK